MHRAKGDRLVHANMLPVCDNAEKQKRSRYLEVYPLAWSIRSASSHIRIGGCTPKISSGGEAGEDYYPLEFMPSLSIYMYFSP